MAYNRYVILSNTGAIGGGRRLYLRLATWRAPGPPAKLRTTLNGRAYGVLGAYSQLWTFTALVQDVPASLYFSRAEVEAYGRPTTAAAARLKFQDIWGTVHDAAFAAPVDLVPALAPVMEGDEGWYELAVTLRKL
jgi:hypothetical protein